MTTAAIAYPTKTRDLHNHHFDSTIWDEFKFRDDDIIIGTYAKSGATWMQQILVQLLFESWGLSVPTGWPQVRAKTYKTRLRR
jgi:aryl sulfotransferase